MNPGASVFRWRPSGRNEASGAGWAAAVAILFAAVAAISFAVDQSVTLTTPPAPSGVAAGR